MKGIGVKGAKNLNKAGIITLQDLVNNQNKASKVLRMSKEAFQPTVDQAIANL